jgi:hypothetical protein
MGLLGQKLHIVLTCQLLLMPFVTALQAIQHYPLELTGLLPGSDFAARHKYSKFAGVSGSSFSLVNKNAEGRLDVTVEPVFPKCFLLHNVLSPSECEEMIRVSEQIGYEDIKTGVLNNNAWVTWVLDEASVEKPLYERCKEYLPRLVPGIEAGTLSARLLSGLNPRSRFYRYLPNNYETFKSHRDDPNPGAGFVGPRSFSWDLDGERASLLTFLLYLNDDFEGGETTFHLDDGTDVPVRPTQGSVLVFPQVVHRALMRKFVVSLLALRLPFPYLTSFCMLACNRRQGATTRMLNERARLRRRPYTRARRCVGEREG